MRGWRQILVAIGVVVVSAAMYAPTAGAATTLSSSATATLTLSSGQTVTASGSVALTIQQFSVNDNSIVLVGRLNGTLTAVTSFGTVTATFTNVRVSAAITNLRADCGAGTLSFNYRVTVPTKGISVTVDGTPVPLRGAVTLRGSVTITTAEIAAIDPDLATAVGTLICDIETLLNTGPSLDAVVADLNAVLAELSTLA
jgi:hypothetical protein